MEFQEAPRYLRAADSHNIAAHNESWFDDFITGVGDKISNIPAAFVVSAASGLNSFYNSGVAVTNLFRPDDNQLAYNDTGEWISSMDEDLGQYYRDNQGFADMAGFIGTSLIPGLGAVKLLGAGQKALTAARSGVVGSNMSRGTGLLAPSMQVHVQRQAADLAARNATWKLTHGEALRHIRNNAWQGVLEGAAFEAGVMTTMFASPVFDDMDAMDMVKNMGIGIALGGGIGTIIGGATSYFGTTRLLKNADARQREFATTITQVGKYARNEANEITASAFDLQLRSAPVTVDEVMARKVAQGETGESTSMAAVESEVRFLNQERELVREQLQNTIRKDIRSLYRTPADRSRKDDFFGNFVADEFQNLGPNGMYDLFDNARMYGRMGDQSAYESEVRALMRDAKITREEALTRLGADNTTYVQLHSGGIADVLDDAPGSFVRLADNMKPDGIKKFVDKQRFSEKKPLSFLDDIAPRNAEARWFWARNLTKPLDTKQAVNVHDLPLFEKAVRDRVDSLTVVQRDGQVLELSGVDEILNRYRQSQIEVAQEAVRRNKQVGEIEAISDIRADSLQGAPKLDPSDTRNFSAQASYAEELSQHLGRDISPAQLHLYPKYMKVSYLNQVRDDDGMILRGMQIVKYQQKQYMEAATRASSKYFGQASDALIDYNDEALARAWRGGTGQGTYTNAGGAYGSTESITSANATVLAHIKKERMGAVHQAIDPYTSIMLQEPEVAVRFSAINEIVSGTPEKYVLNANHTALVPRKIRDYEEAIAAGREVDPPTLAQGTREEIPLIFGEENTALRDLVEAHISLNAKRNSDFGELLAVQGHTSRKYGDTFYPIRQDPRQYKHVAFVVDNKLSGVGHKRMILARSGDELEQLITKVPPEYKIVRKQQAEDYHQAVGDWLYDRTLHENYLDTDLTSRGIRSNFFPMTDPEEIANTFLQNHIRGEEALFREAVATRFQPFIDEMERLGNLYAQAHGSSTEAAARLAVSTKNNPYLAQVKSLFNISRIEDAPGWWLSTNRALDRAVSSGWRRVEELWRNPKLGAPERVEEVNKIMEDVGFKSAYYDSTLQVLANSKIPQGVLAGFVRKANAFLTSTILRLDVFNAFNNKLGNSILMSGEIQSLMQGIRQGDANVAGKLSALADIAVPGSGGDTIPSPMKLISNAYRMMHGPDRARHLQELRDHGLVFDYTDQIYQALDTMTLTGAETVRDMSKKSEQIMEAFRKIGDKGSRYTGNEYAESMNRLASAMVMKQITDLAVEGGIMQADEAWSYINTFTNRVNGAIRAAERPMMFQGPIGQAIGLFQSYQFNLMQQLLRHIGEGRGKTVALLGGMQASIYGASSLPGFNLINNHLVGGASGNPDHNDIYSIAQTVFGKEGAEWLMYGAPSNILNASLYTRGNTNPRVWHIVPNPANPTDIPFINAFTQAIGSVKTQINSVQEGAPVWGSFLSGLEHLGLSRPLAGIAASARAATNEGTAYTTQRSGNFLYENDFLSWATLVRIAGAKPMDEAIMQNHYYRVQAYAAADRESRNKIGTAIRQTIQSDGEVSNDLVNNFAENYVQRGGNAERFNQFFMSQYRNATVSQAEQMAQSLSNDYARRLQQLMGGRDSLGEL